MIVLNSLLETIFTLLIITATVLMLNYLFINDFRKLIDKIKRVISSPRKANKITQIKSIIYEYLFID